MTREQRLPREIRSRVRILVVEDNLLNQKLDSFLFSGWGLKHEICDNGQKAIERLKLARFDVVLMDIRMPVMDGYEATRIIRNELHLDVPIIGITAHASLAEKTRCLAGGMNNYLSKPVNESHLFTLLCQYLVPQQVESWQEEE